MKKILKAITFLSLAMCFMLNSNAVHACNENGRTDMHDTNPRTQTVYIAHELLQDYANQQNAGAIACTTLGATLVGLICGGPAGAGVEAGAGGTLGTLLTTTVKTNAQRWLEESNMHGKCGVKLYYREKQFKGFWPDWTYTGFDPQ
mgnify:CR=1 FL=1